LPSCFPIGDARNTKLCMTQSRWRELVGKPGTEGCLSNRVSVVSRAEAIHKPKLTHRTGRMSLAGRILPWESES
jgi:hypothetical protein